MTTSSYCGSVITGLPELPAGRQLRSGGTYFSDIILAATGGDAAAATAAGAVLTGFFIFWIIFWIIGILLFIFWIFMIIDAVRRDNWKQDSDKMLWILIIVLVGILGAIIYYFAAKRPLDTEAKVKK